VLLYGYILWAKKFWPVRELHFILMTESIIF